ncbi:hypothetical protein PENSPDRAFT_581651 [Peniophora sp. CONT]|nr:hypothetical protein PENSPDRAFT_581651 [Peniophora sp. CONT]
MIPQSKYRPYTPGDRDRYLNKIQLLEPVLFNTTNPGMIGIALSDALAGKYHQLDGRDDRLFHSSGPSISIRINWAECYPSWSRQIPTRDFKNPPGPVTRSKVARNVARSVQRFIDEMNTRALEEDSDIGWAVGRARNGIVLEDLALVRLEHVSKGSWEARLCFVHAGVNKGPLADRYI